MALSRGRKFLATGSMDSTARLWDVADGKEVRSFEGPASMVSTIAFSRDAKWLVSGNADHVARLWDVSKEGQQPKVLSGHSGPITSMVLTEDGKRLASASHDGTIRFWDLGTGQTLCRLLSFQGGTWAVTDGRGRYDAANDGNVDSLHWVAGRETFALKMFQERAFDPGLLAKHLGLGKAPLRKVNGN